MSDVTYVYGPGKALIHKIEVDPDAAEVRTTDAEGAVETRGATQAEIARARRVAKKAERAPRAASLREAADDMASGRLNLVKLNEVMALVVEELLDMRGEDDE